MKITSLFEKHEYVLSFVTILVVVTASNLHAVFGLDMLFLDDNARLPKGHDDIRTTIIFFRGRVGMDADWTQRESNKIKS